MRVPRSGAIAAAVILTLGAGACSKSKTASTTTSTGAGSSTSAPGATATTPGAATNAIAIKGFKFVPDPSSAKVGATITVTNEDGTEHSLTANDGSFDTDKFSSGSKTITVSKAGTFAIHCRVHNFMTGTITVSP